MSDGGFLAGVDWSSVAWGAAVAVVLFVVSIAAVMVLVVLMPATYFVDPPGAATHRHPVLRWTLLVLKNVLGVVLVVMGFVMLITPGQGVLTILIGVALLNFPGKRALERKLITWSGTLGSINRLRARFGKEPVVLEEVERTDSDGSGRGEQG
jgi:hypothetical protein